jgi:hypothetical protein
MQYVFNLEPHGKLLIRSIETYNVDFPIQVNLQEDSDVFSQLDHRHKLTDIGKVAFWSCV